MSIHLAAGTVIMAGLPAEWSPDRPAPLDQVPAGAVILFARNLNPEAGPAGVRRLCDRIRATLAEHHPEAPLPLIAIDHEGGRVNRLRDFDGVTDFPPNAERVGRLATADAEPMVMAQGATMGRELAALGIDWNLAPLADVVTAPEASPLAARVYGDDPERVGRLAAAFCRGLASSGVRGCLKHWPGYGPVGRDPHHHVVETTIPQAEWEAVHLPAFQIAGRSADSIMTAHLAYPYWSGGPATIDPGAYQALRSLTGFRGPVLTDDLEMAAVADLYPGRFGGLAVDALEAGADMVLVCHTPERVVEAYRCVIQAGDEGRLDLEASAGRLAALQ